MNCVSMFENEMNYFESILKKKKKKKPPIEKRDMGVIARHFIQKAILSFKSNCYLIFFTKSL